MPGSINFDTALITGTLPVAALGSATTSVAGTVRKSAALTVASPTLLVPALLTAAVSLATVQSLQARLEELIANLQAAGIQT